MPSTVMSSRWLLILALPVLLRVLKTRRGPSREKIIPPNEERVVLLGASSGVGKDLALTYARRGAKMYVSIFLSFISCPVPKLGKECSADEGRCIFARRKEVLESVKAECLAVGLKVDRVICVTGDVTNTKDLVKLRYAVVKGMTSPYSS
jgi:NAD(P)-dependent dehydrogenase (short-subunit alcohol dehydrogenase family)